MSTADAVILAVILLGVIFTINRVTEQIAHQTQVLVAALADLKPKPPSPDEKQADMPHAIWVDVEEHRREWKEEQERVDSAEREQWAYKVKIAKANKKTFGRKAAVARLEATLDRFVEREKGRLEQNKARIAERNQRLLTTWKAQPYQLWSRDDWGDTTWRCNGGWRRLADIVEQM